MDPKRWVAAYKDPVKFLSSLSPEELDTFATDDEFVARVNALKADLDAYLSEPRWYQAWSAEQEDAGQGRRGPASIAYFSPEFGITSALPQYSGGLGILAGDHLKSASDLGVPIVGVGLFYKTGYFKQRLNRAGWQEEDYPVVDPDGMPLTLLREADGSACRVVLILPGARLLRAHVWRASVGRVPLLLLDSDLQENDEAARMVTNRLYGGGGEMRLQQEMLLGMGGVRALRLWSRLTGAPAPDVFHTNEGHAGFLGVERISELTREGLAFDEALSAVRSSTVFTTHTPVPAGIDRFDAEIVEHHFDGAAELPGVPVERLLELGAESYEGGARGIFNMAVMGLRLSQRANGVSMLHGVVSRQMFHGLWPGFDDSEVPITSITNGVHSFTWVDPSVFDVAQRRLGTTAVEADDAWSRINDVPRQEIWGTKRALREQLVMDARRRLRLAWKQRGASAAELSWVDEALDPDILTIGFARRVPTYKRLTLMLRDPERLKRLLLDQQRPIQLVIAGKAHPADETGKQLIQQMVQFADQEDVRHRVVFLPNYDIAMARVLYPGCDVWLNNPLRPLEACGTSGMKAALNGALNLSVLDGWWDEWFDGGNGWAIPTADGVADETQRDTLEANALYDLIESQIAPRFYDVDHEGLPQNWLTMMVHTLSTLGPKVLASRMVRDYTEKLYLPAARSGWAASDHGYAGAKDLAAYSERARTAWPNVRVDHVESRGVDESPQVGDTLRVTAYASLATLAPEEVQVQLVHGRVGLDSDDLTDFVTQPLALEERYEGGRARFGGDVRLTHTGPFGYTVRIVPEHAGLATVAELGLVAHT